MKIIYGETTIKVPDNFLPVLIELGYFFGYRVAEKLEDYMNHIGEREWLSVNTLEFSELSELIMRVQAGDVNGD